MAISCLNNYTLQGVPFDCNANLAGIRNVWLTYYDAVSVDLTEAVLSSHTISAITLSAGTEWYKYSFARNSSSLNSTLTKDDANGTRYYTNTLTLVFNKLEAQKHLEAMALSAEKLAALVEDNNGHVWFLGADSYVSGVSEEIGTGASADDRNGYNITIEGTSGYLPFEFTGALPTD